jgi:YidC/Oxa1 family membrane protein insertase
MEKSTILRWLIIGVAIWLAWTYLPKLWGGGSEGGTSGAQPLGAESTCDRHLPCAPKERAPEVTCELQGTRFRALFSSQGASLAHLWLDAARYREGNAPIDLVTTPGVEQRRPLRFDWRAKGADSQVAYDAFDWALEAHDATSCTFAWSDDKVQLRRTVRATARPFELELESTIKNLDKDKRAHRLSVEITSWRRQDEVESSLGRQSPFVSDVSCMHDGKMQRLSPGDFEPKDFADAPFRDGWYVQPGAVDFAAVSNFYFSQALVPVSPPASACAMQIEERWNADQFPNKTKDPSFGAMYRSRLVFEPRELATGEQASYRLLAYLGPKERDVLAAAAEGRRRLGELVDLGYFSIIAKYLLVYLVWLHAKIGNWGVAIILMTISVRVLLFPLTWKSIKSGLAMRKLKPDIDALNLKYKDNPQAKNAATMELWKKHKVNPFGGCLPVVFQLPVWWAMYTSLQTSVELYHTPFLWFRDLSAPDPFYVLPLVLGGTMILQQRMMPQQLDPMQQKMVTYVMPAVFTVMMLFLPSGLAVYMLTNSVLGILQQLVIEKYSGGPTASPPGSGIVVIDKTTPTKSPPGGKKGNGTVRKEHVAA